LFNCSAAQPCSRNGATRETAASGSRRRRCRRGAETRTSDTTFAIDSPRYNWRVPAPDVAAAFKRTLDAHGYGFHYAVLERCIELASAAKSPWSFEASELPVNVGEQNTRIDFILRTNNAVLIAECKRANPALARWCFARAPYVARRTRTRRVRLEQFLFEPHSHKRITRPMELKEVKDQYHVAVEMRTTGTGDEGFRGRGAIDDAANQVIRGANGFINFVGDNPGVMDTLPMFVLPVIFTTASLLCSEANLAKADLRTGEIPPGPLRERQWIWFQQNVSAALEHSLPKVYAPEPQNSVAEMLRFRHARSIAIVTPDGISEFLRMVANDFGRLHVGSLKPRRSVAASGVADVDR
jgi:hypothetical protein